MDAIVTAGGIPLPDEPLYEYTRGKSKAMLDVAGKPMVQWVLDALSESKVIRNVVVIGLTEKSGLTCRKPVHYLSNQGKMLENMRAGAQKAQALDPKASHFLVVSSDIPAITGEMVDWVVNAAMQTNEDIYYNVIPRPVMDKRFPNSKRTWTHLKDMDVCGGDMNVARIRLVTHNEAFWEKIINSRKSPIKQAGLIGLGTLIPFLFRRLSLEALVKKVIHRLNLTGRAIVCPYAEVGMDVDKPHQLEMLRADLKKRQKQAEKGLLPKGRPAAKKNKPRIDPKKIAR